MCLQKAILVETCQMDSYYLKTYFEPACPKRSIPAKPV
jgi:hypothetical protein